MSESVNGQESAPTCSADQLRHQLVSCYLLLLAPASPLVLWQAASLDVCLVLIGFAPIPWGLDLLFFDLR